MLFIIWPIKTLEASTTVYLSVKFTIRRSRHIRQRDSSHAITLHTCGTFLRSFCTFWDYSLGRFRSCTQIFLLHSNWWECQSSCCVTRSLSSYSRSLIVYIQIQRWISRIIFQGLVRFLRASVVEEWAIYSFRISFARVLLSEIRIDRTSNLRNHLSFKSEGADSTNIGGRDHALSKDEKQLSHQSIDLQSFSSG